MTLPMWVGALVVALWLAYTRTGRVVAVVGVVLIVLIGLKRALVRDAGGCEPLGVACKVDLQPTWAGPCLGTAGGAVTSEDGRYVLLSGGSPEARATCIDIRIYR